MDARQIEQRVAELREQLRYHNHRYYVLNDPLIADTDYDRLLKELVALEIQHPELRVDDSPSMRVGAAPQDKFARVIHRAPMLSLDGTLEPGDVRAFAVRAQKTLGAEARLAYSAELKLDGLSVELVYEKGLLIKGSTRGDGYEGEDVTANIRTIGSVPLRLLEDREPVPTLLAVRGEVVMPVMAFEAFNKQLAEQGEDLLANPRNAAAGSLRVLDSRVTASRPLVVYVYDLLLVEGRMFTTQFEIFRCLEAWGFKVHSFRRRCESIEEVLQYHQEVAAGRESLDIEIDGIVVKVEDLGQRDRLGAKDRSPRWAMALKFPPRREETQVMDIAVQIGRTGVLTPVALLKPVDVSGVTVSRATLHNLEFIEKMDVRIGDLVRVARAGDVIPEVVEVLVAKRKGDERRFLMPVHCPACGSHVIREGAFYVCTGGLSCKPQLKARIAHFVSKPAMDIESLGFKTVSLLVEKGMIVDLGDIYRLEKSDLLPLEGFAERSADNLLAAIDASHQRPLHRFLYALGIKHVGAYVAKVVAQQVQTLDNLRRATGEQLLAIHEIGPQTARSIVEFFQEPTNQAAIDKLLANGVAPEPAPEPISVSTNDLEGKTFVFTGGLATLSRTQAKELVERKGGIVSSAVSARTDYVVVGEAAGSKYEKARALGLAILDEAAFLTLLEK
ncbi:NAD-dependent DNA ligase LigA [bacterium]|nr:NAD-dependent DNA ligase LigA [candidate division CSSED10-310 bacterium]